MTDAVLMGLAIASLICALALYRLDALLHRLDAAVSSSLEMLDARIVALENLGSPSQKETK
jgi:hypothetical protein